MIMNGDLERMWKEEVMAYFKVSSWHLPGGTEEYHKKPQFGQLVFWPNYKWGVPKYTH
jgi:hypothetical protein